MVTLARLWQRGSPESQLVYGCGNFCGPLNALVHQQLKCSHLAVLIYGAPTAVKWLNELCWRVLSRKPQEDQVQGPVLTNVDKLAVAGIKQLFFDPTPGRSFWTTGSRFGSCTRRTGSLSAARWATTASPASRWSS